MINSKAHTPIYIVIRGRHYVGEPIELTAKDSGLHLRNYDGEAAELTGARALKDLKWTQHTLPPPPPPPSPTPPSFYANMNNVYGRVPTAGKSTPTVQYLGTFADPHMCQGACNTTAACLSWTWHPNTSGMGAYKQQCYASLTPFWEPRAQPGIYSGQAGRSPTPPPSPPHGSAWVADVSSQLKAGVHVFGLRVNGDRAIRAR